MSRCWQSVGKFEVPKCTTVKELVGEYVKICGHNKWGVSTYDGKESAIDATVPKAKKEVREIWTAEMLMQALEACDNKILKINCIS